MAPKAFGNVLEEMFSEALGEAPRAATPSATVQAECSKAKPGERIGFVLPFAAAFEEPWAATRRMFAREFTDVSAIMFMTAKAPSGKVSLANIGMPELIVIATRRGESASKSAMINCVNLYIPVTRPGHAEDLAPAICQATDNLEGAWSHQPIKVEDREFGQVCAFDAGGSGALWAPLGVAHLGLGKAADSLTRGRLEFDGVSTDFGIGMTTLKRLFRVGPAHSLIGHERGKRSAGAFEFVELSESADAAGANGSLWSVGGERQRSLVVTPTHKGVPVSGRSEQCREMKARRSRLFYARGRGMQWTAQASIAAMTKNAAMGGPAWTGLENDDIRICKAFALWANSTFGMLVHWTQGQKTQVGRSTAQVRALGRIPCPGLDALGGEELDLAAAEFDAVASIKLLPACRAHSDETRWKIDSAVVRMLGLPEKAHEAVAGLRLHWCHEPSVYLD